MADTFFEELGAYLQTKGVGTYGLDSGTGWGIYVFNAPASVGKCVVLNPVPGSSDPDVPVSSLTFQVLVFAKSSKEGIDKAKEVLLLLHQDCGVVLTSIYCYNFTCTINPYYAGLDDNERAIITATYTAFARDRQA
jgi:hypothetical protein